MLGDEGVKLQVAQIKLSHSRVFLMRAYLLQTHVGRGHPSILFKKKSTPSGNIFHI